MTTLEQFLKLDGSCFDVRSPKEYLHAHIPGAINLPLFNDEERALVGTCYKKQGQQEAIRLGVKLVAPKLYELMQSAEGKMKSGHFKVYCWRGGMRSGFFSFFFRFIGYDTIQLQGGYKAFRRAVLNSFLRPYPLFLIGGLTGSGKTEILHALKEFNQQVIDLEGIACHRGSVYGDHEEQKQPSCEQFENELGMALHKSDFNLPIWIEDESRLIGQCAIPGAFFQVMRKAPLFYISCPLDERIDRLCQLYSKTSMASVIRSTLKIQKRLGGSATQEIVSLIEAGRAKDVAWRLLQYYDRSYEFAMSKHCGPIVRLPEKSCTAHEWAKLLMESYEYEV